MGHTWGEFHGQAPIVIFIPFLMLLRSHENPKQNRSLLYILNGQEMLNTQKIESIWSVLTILKGEIGVKIALFSCNFSVTMYNLYNFKIKMRQMSPIFYLIKAEWCIFGYEQKKFESIMHFLLFGANQRPSLRQPGKHHFFADLQPLP